MQRLKEVATVKNGILLSILIEALTKDAPFDLAQCAGDRKRIECICTWHVIQG